MTSFEDHARWASVDVPGPVCETHPFDAGLRLSVDRTVVYEAGLLDGSVALTPLDDGLRVEVAE